jgi:PTS system fructose-specific IIA component/PTS system nitrogen regulatory IIA component
VKLADFIVPEAILPDLRATTKEEAVREMVSSLCAAGCIAQADAENVLRAVLNREALGTTGVGDGVAFPEARHPAARRTLGTIALSRGGVAFDSIDGGPAHILCLVVSPPDRPRDFLRAVEMMSWLLLRHEAFRDRLRDASTRDEIIALIAEADRDIHWEEVLPRSTHGPQSGAPSGA